MNLALDLRGDCGMPGTAESNRGSELSETHHAHRKDCDMVAENEAARTGDEVVPQRAKAPGGRTARQASGSEIASNPGFIGIDTDRLTEAAGERVSELQRLLIEEVRAQPLRALAWAAAAGVIVGLWAAR